MQTKIDSFSGMRARLKVFLFLILILVPFNAGVTYGYSESSVVISLNEGWNLISMPLIPQNPSIESVLEPVEGLYNSVLTLKDGEILKYDPRFPLSSDFTTIESGCGYLIDMKKAGTLSFRGTTAPYIVELNTGWNMVSANNVQPVSIKTATSSIEGQFITFMTLKNGEWQTYNPRNPGSEEFQNIYPGEGCMIYVGRDVSWNVDLAPKAYAGRDLLANEDEQITLNAIASYDPNGSPLNYRWSVVSQPSESQISLIDEQSMTANFSADTPGLYTVQLIVNDGTQDSSPSETRVLVIEEVVDPASIAPELSLARTTPFLDAVKFLFSGSNPVQKNVTEQVFDSRRISIVQGAVFNREGQPLQGVKISVFNRDEFGYTMTRSDGHFDICINGGGRMIIKYEKNGYLPVHRVVHAPWNNFSQISDLVMIPMESIAAQIDLAEPGMKIFQGSLTEDERGSRRSTMLFPEGVQASLEMPDGTYRYINRFTIRSTEYTIGANGTQTMPAPLPAFTGYTYAVEHTVDEAFYSGARSVQFDFPLINYVDNFLDVPVGAVVPSGYYDKQDGAWKAMENGKVVEILGINDGMAELDTTGDGKADNDPELGITKEERIQIASIYEKGETLWRMPISHFSPCDFNFSFAFPLGVPWPSFVVDRINRRNAECAKAKGSYLVCEAQRLGQTIPVYGTPYTLNYRNDRVPGFISDNLLRIQLTGDEVDSRIKRIELEISVAGQEPFTMEWEKRDIEPNMEHLYVWNGKDAYGRPIEGTQQAFISIGYVYNLQYNMSPEAAAASWAYVSTGEYTVDEDAGEGTLWTRGYKNVGGLTLWGEDGYALGGWSINVHHAYDAAASTLYLGDGSYQNGRDNVVSELYAGNAKESANYAYSDGLPATETWFYLPSGIAVAEDGTIYFSEGNRVRKVDTDGIVRTVAGKAENDGYNGDNIPAKQALLNEPKHLTLGTDGSLYIADYANNRIRRVDPRGVITTVAGTGDQGYSGDDRDATRAKLNGPWGIVTAPDGNIYFSDSNNHVIRRITPDGIIQTIAGTGDAGYSGDGDIATRTKLNYPLGIDVDQDGVLYMAEWGNRLVRKVGTDGYINTVAGNMQVFPQKNEDGGLATMAALGVVSDVAVGPHGNIYIGSELSPDQKEDNPLRGERSIRVVDSRGIINTFAGLPAGAAWKESITWRDGGPARGPMLDARAVEMAPDGSLYSIYMFSEFTRNGGIIKLTPPTPLTLAITEEAHYAIPAEDGTELYLMDEGGIHLQTLDTFTNRVIYEFDYDLSGRLTGITDINGLRTVIERDSQGRPVAITGPYGDRTVIAIDGFGYLASATNPNGKTVSVSYYTPMNNPLWGIFTEGLLMNITDENGNTSKYNYDSYGNLIKATDPLDGFVSLERENTDSGYTVTATTAMGNSSTVYMESTDSTGDLRGWMQDLDGARISLFLGSDGSQSYTYPDGTVVTTQFGPDPRFGMQVPVLNTQTTTLANGKSTSLVNTREATWEGGFALVSQTDTLTMDEKTWMDNFDGSTLVQTSTWPDGSVRKTYLDAKHNVTRVAWPESGLQPMIFDYDNNGRLIRWEHGNLGVDYTYNGKGLVKNFTNSNGDTWRYEYDSAGFPVSVTLPEGSEYSSMRDNSGKVTDLLMPDGTKNNLSYDARNNLESYALPDETVYNIEYNLDEMLQAMTLPGGSAVDISYDQYFRWSETSFPEGSFSVVYDDMSRIQTLRRQSALDMSMQSTTADYESGHLIKNLHMDGFLDADIFYGYDSNLALSYINLVTANDSAKFRVGRDELGRMEEFGVEGTTPFEVKYDGPLASLNSINDGNMMLYSRQYNDTGWISSATQKMTGSTVYEIGYNYGADGRLAQKTETISGSQHIYKYFYNGRGYLEQVFKDGLLFEEYTYDERGNRLTTVGNQLSKYNAQDQLTSDGSQTYEYDRDGFLSRRGNDVFIYSRQGELIEAVVGGEKIHFYYDQMPRRVGYVAGNRSCRYIYANPGNPLQLTATEDSEGKLTYYYYVQNRLVGLERDDKRFYVFSDEMGTPLMVHDSNGKTVKTLKYDSFGNVLEDTNPDFEIPIGFAGGLVDPVTNLVRFWVRDYDPAAGRWTARDPLFHKSGQLNFYAYAANDPVNLVDPTGRSLDDDIAAFIDDHSDYIGNNYKSGNFYFGVTAKGFSGVGGGIEMGFGMKDGQLYCGGSLLAGFGGGGSIEAQIANSVPSSGAELAAEAKTKLDNATVQGSIKSKLRNDPCMSPLHGISINLKGALGPLSAEAGYNTETGGMKLKDAFKHDTFKPQEGSMGAHAAVYGKYSAFVPCSF